MKLLQARYNPVQERVPGILGSPPGRGRAAKKVTDLKKNFQIDKRSIIKMEKTGLKK
jgi:hypothetical protein